ncbi:hypothetical protein KSP39_PZI014514 [Platanthera zijinensis]|uniref:Uncharacterized protein n=1 Tax=Platanthera zijinensis TaxID=2320716 RepID=A0AAP0BB52_9ASPA
MAILLVRLRRALLRSSSIPCSFSPIPSDSSHLINLSKTLFSAASLLENPSIRPTPSKHDRRSPSTSSNPFLFRSHYRQFGTKIAKDEINNPKFPKPSPEEMLETSFQNLAKVLKSVEDPKVIEKLSHKLTKTCKEMIGQLKGACRRQNKRVEGAKVIEEMSDKFEKIGLRKTEQLKADKCRNEVISTSPLPEYENYISDEDLKMIHKMHEKLTECVEVLEKLKVKHAFTLHLSRFYIDGKDNKSEGDKCWNAVITPRPPSPLHEYENHASVEDLEMVVEMLEKLTKYVKVLKKLKARHAFVPYLSPVYIDSKDLADDATDWPEYFTPRQLALRPEYENLFSEEDLEMIDEIHEDVEELTKYVKELKKLKDATCWNEDFSPRQLPLLPEYGNHLSVEELEMIDEMHEELTKYVKVLKKLKELHCPNWRSYAHDRNSSEVKPRPRSRPLVLMHTCPLMGGLRQPFTTKGVDIARFKRDLYWGEGIKQVP